ncbi:MAG: transposase [Bacteroidales bacterium]|nr:transposase [Bacteroidales bacterium]
MKSKKRPFQKDILIHCYQRTADHGLLFYCYSDYLVWYTLICTAARRHKVRIMSACAMPDHIHLSVVAKTRKDLSGFMRDWASGYACMFNALCHKTGPLFETYGSAPKYGDKKARTNLIYVGNNPVERRLVTKAEDYRWNFLAYACSDFPFSKKLVLRKARWPLQKAVREVRAQFKAGRHMTYPQLKRLFKPLTQEERQQLTDFIISTYKTIDYPAVIRYFDSYNEMLLAMHANTGSEYDLNETFIGKSDAHYSKMIAVVMENLRPKDIHDILALSPEKKYEVFQLIRKHSDAMGEQIAHFLHLPLKIA